MSSLKSWKIQVFIADGTRSPVLNPRGIPKMAIKKRYGSECHRREFLKWDHGKHGQASTPRQAHASMLHLRDLCLPERIRYATIDQPAPTKKSMNRYISTKDSSPNMNRKKDPKPLH